VRCVAEVTERDDNRRLYPYPYLGSREGKLKGGEIAQVDIAIVVEVSVIAVREQAGVRAAQATLQNNIIVQVDVAVAVKVGRSASASTQGAVRPDVLGVDVAGIGSAVGPRQQSVATGA
jgi:hypothetical protein